MNSSGEEFLICFLNKFSIPSETDLLWLLPKGSHINLYCKILYKFLCLSPFKSSEFLRSISPVSNGTFNMSHSRFTSISERLWKVSILWNLLLSRIFLMLLPLLNSLSSSIFVELWSTLFLSICTIFKKFFSIFPIVFALFLFSNNSVYFKYSIASKLFGVKSPAYSSPRLAITAFSTVLG